jgi:hypothetical protein
MMSLIPGLDDMPLQALLGASAMSVIEKPLELFGKDLFKGRGLEGTLGLGGQFLESPVGEMADSASHGPYRPLTEKKGRSVLEKEGSSPAKQKTSLAKQKT